MSRKTYMGISKDSSASNHHTWVCSLCYPFALELGHIWGCGSLIYMKNHPLDKLAPEEYGDGKFAILHGQGHRDDESIIFDERPRVDVYGKYKLKSCYPEQMKFTLNAAFDIIETAKEVGGYNEGKHGRSFDYFFINELHNMIMRWERKNGKLETYYDKFVKEREVYLIQKRKDDEVRLQAIPTPLATENVKG